MLNLNNVVFYGTDRVTPLTTPPTSPCPASGCRNCVIPRPMVTFHYTPGDVIVTGLFDIHAQGTEVLSCGMLKAVHARNAAAFRYALNTVKNQFSGVLNGVELGSLMIDLCDNGETGRLFLNNVLGGRHIVADMNGQVVDPNQLKSVVGELDSTEAMSMASMLGHFNLPYLESSATSVTLSDRDMYPTFSRAVPSDYHQMLAIVLILKRNNWDYVQVVHTGDTYGRSGAEIIKAEASSRGICIAAMHELSDSMNALSVVRNLQEKPNAKIVIAIVDTSDYRSLLMAMQSENVQGSFRLIGTETWGQSSSVVSGLESVADGSITVALAGPSIAAFESWLGSLNPADANVVKENPFFAEWYQYEYSCYLDAENRGLYTTECNSALPITSAPNYDSSSTYTPFMISSTYAVVRAINQAILDLCGAANAGLCWQFRSHPQLLDTINSYIRESMFTNNGYQFKMINGEGLANYYVYQYRGSSSQYVQVSHKLFLLFRR